MEAPGSLPEGSRRQVRIQILCQIRWLAKTRSKETQAGCGELGEARPDDGRWGLVWFQCRRKTHQNATLVGWSRKLEESWG